MWPLETIRQINAEAGEEWKEEGPDLPVLRHPDEVVAGAFKIPYIGDADEEVELELIESLFCDLSGWGNAGEPALTQYQLLEKLKELITEHGPITLAMVSRGAFQGHVDVWKTDK